MLVGIFHVFYAQSNPSHDRNAVLSSNEKMLEVIVLRKQVQQVKKSHPGEESHGDWAIEYVSTYAPGSKLPILRTVIPPLTGNPYTGLMTIPTTGKQWEFRPQHIWLKDRSAVNDIVEEKHLQQFQLTSIGFLASTVCMIVVFLRKYHHIIITWKTREHPVLQIG